MWRLRTAGKGTMGQQRRTWPLFLTSQDRNWESLQIFTKQSEEQGQSRKGYKQAAAAEQGGGEGCGSLLPPSTFLFPRWGWEVIGNDSRIPFLPFLWFWFLLLGRERI